MDMDIDMDIDMYSPLPLKGSRCFLGNISVNEGRVVASFDPAIFGSSQPAENCG
jgi:hypothetical protein